MTSTKGSATDGDAATACPDETLPDDVGTELPDLSVTLLDVPEHPATNNVAATAAATRPTRILRSQAAERYTRKS